jgi:hypothetical protein
MNKLKYLIAHLRLIIAGWFNAHLSTDEKKKEVAEARLKICRSNTCRLYDKEGVSPKAYLPGRETCGGCGCPLVELCSSMDSTCSLAEIGQRPLWGPQETLKD